MLLTAYKNMLKLLFKVIGRARPSSLLLHPPLVDIWRGTSLPLCRAFFCLTFACRVNITLPERVLALIDEAARRSGESRSGYLARVALEAAGRGHRVA